MAYAAHPSHAPRRGVALIPECHQPRRGLHLVLGAEAVYTLAVICAHAASGARRVISSPAANKTAGPSGGQWRRTLADPHLDLGRGLHRWGRQPQSELRRLVRLQLSTNCAGAGGALEVQPGGACGLARARQAAAGIGCGSGLYAPASGIACSGSWSMVGCVEKYCKERESTRPLFSLVISANQRFCHCHNGQRQTFSTHVCRHTRGPAAHSRSPNATDSATEAYAMWFGRGLLFQPAFELAKSRCRS